MQFKIREQAEFVKWLQENVRNEGRYKATGALQGQLENETGITHQQVSKWKKRLETSRIPSLLPDKDDFQNPERYAFLHGMSLNKP